MSEAERELDILDRQQAVDGDLGDALRHLRFLNLEQISTPLEPQAYRIRLAGLNGDLFFTGPLADVVEEVTVALRQLDQYGAGPPSSRIKPGSSQ